MLFDIGMGYAIIISALIAAFGSVTTAWLQLKTRRDMRPPSGGTIGEVVERTHHTSAVNTAGIKRLIEVAESRGAPREPPPDDTVESE